MSRKMNSLAAKYTNNRMSIKCILVADNEKHGKIMFDRVRKFKSGGENDSNTSDDSGGQFVEELVHDSASQAFFRKATTTVVKMYEVTEFMDMFDMRLDNVVVMSFLGCYGNDMDFVPARKSLENALLEMGMPYDDSELDKKESRRILYNLVLLRKLKLLREFLKLLKFVLPSYKVHALLLLPLHLNISHHETPSTAAVRNSEFLLDLNLNVIHAMGKQSGVQVDFVDARGRSDLVGTRAVEALVSYEKRREQKGSMLDLAHRHNPLLTIGKMHQGKSAACENRGARNS